MKLIQYILYLIGVLLQNLIDILDYWELKLDCRRSDLPKFIDRIYFIKPLWYKDYFDDRK